MKNLILVIVLTIIFSSCGRIRTDGGMSLNGDVVGMIYFKTKNPKKILSNLQKDFGIYSKGNNSQEYLWTGVSKTEWSQEPLDMKIIETNELSKEKVTTLSVAIVSKSGRTLTDNNHPQINNIKEYFIQLLFESEK